MRMQEEVAEGSIRGSTHITSYQFMDDRCSVLGVPITSSSPAVQVLSFRAYATSAGHRALPLLLALAASLRGDRASLCAQLTL